MKQISKQHAVVFFVGFLVMTCALGYGGLAGDIFTGNPTLVSIRFLAASLMFSGLTLWICLSRDEAGKPGLNTFLIFVLATGVLLVVVRLALQSDLSVEFLSWGGIALTGAGLLIGFLSMLISPAMAKPLTARWPEGGEPSESESRPAAH